jgi:biotin carboxyl carrier protein
MKYTVTIENKSYEVDVEDVHARPIIARVNGQRFEVHPDSLDEILPEKETKAAQSQDMQPPAMQYTGPVGLAGNANELTAPLPGTIVEIFVKSGEEIDTGHVILVIEAMKMKNSIRSTRAGKVADVLVSVGQTVSHKQPLVRFE